MRRRLTVCAAAVVISAAVPNAAHAALGIAQFSVTPSTTQAGGHPNLAMSFSLTEPTNEIKDVAVHLPAGLGVNSRAIPFCTRRRLVRNLCLPKSKAGSLVVTVVAYGIDLPVGRDIFNVRPVAAEPLRLGVPILGTFSHPGIAAELPAAARPADGGLDLAVKGLPSEVAGFPVRIKTVTVKLRGVTRIRFKKKVRTKPVLTNPASCTPATSVLEITPQDPAAARVTSSSSFTPSGCGS